MNFKYLRELAILTLTLSALSAYSNTLPPPEKTTLSTSASLTSTTDPAAELTDWYNSRVFDCGAHDKPAYECSGIMLRVTDSMGSFYPWDPSDKSVASGGVSFSWLRNNSRFLKLAWGGTNGLVFYPSRLTPPGKKNDIAVLCAFPMDAATDHRADKGCGAYSSYPKSGMCQKQGIWDSREWIKMSYNPATNKHLGPCGFGMQDPGTKHLSAHFFWASLWARGWMNYSDTMRISQNELRLSTWSRGIGNTLPIHSFFYLKGSNGLTAARRDQQRYYDAYRQIIPIVQIALPTELSKHASFAYLPTDQVIK